jgi:hypothetical protein
MRCTDCKYSKETIPAQLHYVYCTKFEKEMSVVTEFEICQYKDTEEYKIKEAIQNFCNDENNWIVAIKQLDLLNSLAKNFNIPNFIQDIAARRKFENKVFDILNDSKIKFEKSSLITSFDEGGESRENLIVLQKPNL